MKECYNCGTEYEQNKSTKFCKNCGKRLIEDNKTKASLNDESVNEINPSSSSAIWSVISITFLGIVASNIISVIVLFSLDSFGYAFSLENPSLLDHLILTTSVFGFGFVAGLYNYYTSFKLSYKPRRIKKEDYKYLVGSIILCVFISQVVTMGVHISSLELESGLQVDDPSPFIIIGFMLAFIFIVAPSEEYLFRGIIQERLYYGFSSTRAIIGSSIIFTLVHIPNYTGDIEAIAIVILLVHLPLSLIFGYIYEKTENLTVPIVVHAAYNCIIFLIPVILQSF